MEDQHDRDLKDLYQAARTAESESPPDFDELLARSSSRTASKDKKTPWPRRLAAAAALFALLVGAYLVDRSTPEPALDSSPAVEAIAQESSGANDADWEELLDYADSLWEWESPSDFLL